MTQVYARPGSAIPLAARPHTQLLRDTAGDSNGHGARLVDTAGEEPGDEARLGDNCTDECYDEIKRMTKSSG